MSFATLPCIVGDPYNIALCDPTLNDSCAIYHFNATVSVSRVKHALVQATCQMLQHGALELSLEYSMTLEALYTIWVTFLTIGLSVASRLSDSAASCATPVPPVSYGVSYLLVFTYAANRPSTDVCYTDWKNNGVCRDSNTCWPEVITDTPVPALPQVWQAFTHFYSHYSCYVINLCWNSGNFGSFIFC